MIISNSKVVDSKKKGKAVKVLEIEGQQAEVDAVVAELEKLFKQPLNHCATFSLPRGLSSGEIRELEGFLKSKYNLSKIEVEETGFDIFDLQLLGHQCNEARAWVAKNLPSYLMMNYPDEWRSSLD